MSLQPTSGCGPFLSGFLAKIHLEFIFPSTNSILSAILLALALLFWLYVAKITSYQSPRYLLSLSVSSISGPNIFLGTLFSILSVFVHPLM
jgi:hypothetical protein